MAKLQELDSCIKKRKYLQKVYKAYQGKAKSYRVVNKYYISYKQMLYCMNMKKIAMHFPVEHIENGLYLFDLCRYIP